MRLAAALICLALLLPAPAALAGDLRPDGVSKAGAADAQVTLVVPEATCPDAGDTIEIQDNTLVPGPDTVRSATLLMRLLGIIFGQDRLASWEAGPDSQ
jgi:hypothetical protein